MFRQITHKMPFFSQKPIVNSKALLHISYTKEILPNSQIFTKKIARYTSKNLSFPEILDARWHEPIKCIQWRFDEAPLKKFIITRHKNRLSHNPLFHHLNDIVSLIVEGHVSFVQSMLKNFLTPKIGAEILFNDEENLSPRIGLTTNCREENEKERILHFIEAVENLIPLDKESHSILEALIDKENKKGFLPVGTLSLPKAPKNRNLIQNMMLYVENKNQEGTYHNLPFVAQHRIFDPVVHTFVPDTIPAAHQAIFAGDKESLQQLLTTEPVAVKELDPWGLSAYELARCVGPFAIYDICYQAMQKIDARNWFDSLYKPVQTHFRNMWDTTGYNKLVYLTNNSIQPEHFLNEAREQRILQMGQAKLAERTGLHLACIKGDFEQLQSIIMVDRERLNEMDCFGFTPLMLCVAQGHHDMAAWLIEQGALVKNVEFREIDGSITYLRLIDQAKTPETMELLLHHNMDVLEFNDRLITAIKQNDLTMVKYMLYYLHELPALQGLSTLEWILKLTPKYGTNMLEIFLQYYQKRLYVEQNKENIIDFISTLDPNINQTQLEKYGFFNLPEKAISILNKYKITIETKLQQKHNRPKFQSCQLNDDCSIEMIFSNENVKLISIFKRVNDLSQEEIKSIHQLFFNSFKLLYNDNYDNRISYLKYALAPNEHNESFVNLVFHNGKIISFLTFEIDQGVYPLNANKKHSIDFDLYHGKLTANDPNYGALGLTDIAFSSMIAIAKIKENKPLFCFIKAIPPGLGFCVLPRYLKFFPKFHAPQGFVDYIGKLVKDPIYGKKIPVKLTLNTDRKITHRNFERDYFEHVIGEDIKDAMAVITPVDNETVTQYKEALSYNGIHDEQLETITSCWQKLLSLNSQKKIFNHSP